MLLVPPPRIRRLTDYVAPRIALELALGVALLASLGMVLRQAGQLATARRQQEADRKSLHALQEALRQHELAKAPAEAGVETPAPGIPAALARREAAIQRLNRDLNDARTEIAQLQAQLLNSSDERDRALASADERYRKDQADWQHRLDELKQELDSAQAESQAARERVTALEATNAKLRSDNTDASGRASDMTRVVADLADVDRRREAYLTSIMRRYRDITSQFRALGGMLDSGRDPNSSALSGAALTRIQNAVSLADDDLRQLNELNARARELQKKLAKK